MQKKSNKQFMVLSIIGIVIMVCCHFSGELYKYVKAFPFIAIFIFISGYFYKEENERNIGIYIWHKFKKLMIPFYILNLLYGIIATILRNADIINYGENITLYNFFIQPFINNSQYILNFPSWFLPTLFLTNISYAIIHKYSKKKEYFLLIILVVAQIITVKFSDLAKNQTIIVCFFKVIFFLPFMQIGFMYKNTWQKLDEKIPTIPYLIILWAINFVAYKKYGNIIYDMHDFSGFINYLPFLPIITSVSSILFFTRISKVLSKYIGDNKIVNYVGNHTFAILCHHVFALFLFDWLLYAINPPYFDIEHFKRGWMYIYEIPGWIIQLHFAYLFLGISIPLVFQIVYDKIKNFLTKSAKFSIIE